MADYTPSKFNVRFTELLDQKIPADSGTLTERLLKVHEETKISISTLRKYYLAPGDVERYKVEGGNRIHEVKDRQRLALLAIYFGVSDAYLIGDSDIRQKDTADFLLSDDGRAVDLTEDIIEALKEIKDLPDSRIYHMGLQWLLEDISGEVDNEGNPPADRKPYHLLYLIGQYFSDLYSQGIAKVNPALVQDVNQIAGREYTTVASLRSYMAQLTESMTWDTVDLDAKYLPDIEKELRNVRDIVNYQNVAVYAAVLKMAEESGKPLEIDIDGNGTCIKIEVSKKD